MKTLFVDTNYWIATTNPKDQLHQEALEFEQNIQSFRLVTTELVLVEYLNYFCTFGSQVRQIVVGVTQDIINDPNIEIVSHTPELFLSGLQLYEARLDKGYSMVDCISMVVMRSLNLMEVLTHDKHFTQEGFQILL